MPILADTGKLLNWSREHGQYLILAVAFGAAICLWLHPNLEGADTSRYLYWTRSLFFDRDLLLINEFEIFGERLLITPTGYALEFHNFGTAIFWLPFYAVAYLIDLFVVRPAEAIRTGFEPVYILLINFSTWIYAGITLLILYGLARRYSSGRAALGAMIFVSLGSSYLYYVAFLPVSSHIVSVFLATIFLTVWSVDRQQSHWRLWLAMGVIGGLLLLVANYNLPYLFLPLLTALRNGYRNGFYRRHLKLVGGYVLSGFLVFMPQLFIWWLYFGSPLTTPYAVQLSWLEPQIILTWFSAWHGLFVFSPIVYLSIPGVYYVFKRDKIMAAGIIIVFLSFSYIVSVNAAWWGGTSFGARYFISLTPIFAISLAAFLHHFKRPIAYLIAALLCLWTVLLYAQTTLGLMNLHNWYPMNEVVLGQWQAVRQLPRLVDEADLPATKGPLFRVVIGLAAGSGIILGAGPLLVRVLKQRFSKGVLVAWPGLVIILIIFIGYAGVNSQAVKSQLVQAGYYQNKQQIYKSDPFDAMKNYRKLAGFYQRQGHPEKAVASIQAAMQTWPNQIRQIVSTPPTTGNPAGDPSSQLAYHPLDLNFGNVVRLTGYSLHKAGAHKTDEEPYTSGNGNDFPSASPAPKLRASLYWERLAAEVDEVDYTFSIKEPGSDREITRYRLEEALLGPSVVGVYPLDEIPDGMFYSDSFDVPYRPANLFGKIELALDRVGLHPRGPNGTTPKSVTIGFINLSASELLQPVDYNFANKMALTGYRPYLDQTRQTLSLVLRWKGLTTPTKDYKIFTHLVDSNDNIIAQRDVDPLSGLRPTSTWRPGEELLDLYDVSLPQNAFLETATILLGFYDLETGERLFLVESDGYSPGTLESFVRLEIR